MSSMEIYMQSSEFLPLIQAWKEEGKKVAFVPTMGALHEGHLSLISLAKEKADYVVVSIFVNPTQFAPHEDFDAYPRDLTQDAQKLVTAGVDILYAPSEAEIYPNGDKCSAIKSGAASQGLETDFRSHFFDGVVNVVNRLFVRVEPSIAIFGEKDYQQLQVIKEMVTEQGMDVEIIGAVIARDDEGLALSSRNAYLSDDELVTARQLNKVVRDFAADSLGEKDAMIQLKNLGFDKVDYIEKRWGRALVAAWLGHTRLIDNVAV